MPTPMTRDLRRRQGGYGRGRRMAIESDTAVIVAGVRHGRTTGAPVAMTIDNRDWVNWQFTMHPDARPSRRRRRRAPRAGHAPAPRPRRSRRRPQVRPRRPARRPRARQRPRDRRARRGRRARPPDSSRQVGIDIASHVFAIGAASVGRRPAHRVRRHRGAAGRQPDALRRTRRGRAHDRRHRRARERRRHARRRLRGRRPTACPPGLGSYAQWDRRLDGRLAQALMSIPAIKAVGIGLGAGRRPAAGVAGPRRNPAARRRARPASAHPPARAGRPTTPAASRAASPTARNCASAPR